MPFPPDGPESSPEWVVGQGSRKVAMLRGMDVGDVPRARQMVIITEVNKRTNALRAQPTTLKMFTMFGVLVCQFNMCFQISSAGRSEMKTTC